MSEADLPLDDNIVTVIFVISGRDFDPDACARAVGLEGYEVWRQRRPELAARADLSNVNVSVTVGPEPRLAIDDPLCELLARVAPLAERVRAFTAAHEARAAVVVLVKVYRERPLYVVSPASIAAIAALGAELSLDIIDLREP